MRIPKLRRHKSGQATARAKRKDYYFGKHGTKEAKAAYEKWLANYLLNNGELPAKKETVTVNHIAAAYLQWAEDRYQKYGRTTGHLRRVKTSLKILCQEAGDLPAESFTLPLYERIQAAMVKKGWARSFVNACCGKIKSVFLWAGAREMVTMERAYRIKAAPGLVRGQTTAPETKPIKPVAQETVWATLPYLSRIVSAMVQIQWYTGMRPGEVCLMRICDIDRSQAPWVYRPARHKTEHHDAEREVYLGPQCREILAPLIAAKGFGQNDQAYLFDPSEAKEEAIRKSGRRVKNGCSKPGQHYTVGAYTRAVVRACKRGEIARWSPLQIRHSRLTETRAIFGPDAARAQAGHRSLSATEVYAELDSAKARTVAERTG